MPGKGFGVPKKPPEDDAIWASSMVASRTLTPAVEIRWGDKKSQFDPSQARHHAYAVLEAVAAAEVDACFMRWAIHKLGLKPEEAAGILHLFRQKRDTSTIPSVTMNLGDEHIRPETARQRATQLFDMAFTTEIEAFLVAFMLQELELESEVINQLIQEFREIRGVKTLWPEEGGDRTND